MDMRNTVILVDQIETDVRERGLSRREAIVFSTMRRARPVALTALAAILAMIPLSESAFWGPMAYTIMGGLSLATFMTLFLLPAIYALWFRKSLDFETSKNGGARSRADGDALDLPAPPEWKSAWGLRSCCSIGRSPAFIIWPF